MQTETEFLSLLEHAERLGVAPKWVANKVAAGTWPARVVRLGRRRLVHFTEHQRLVRELLAAAGIKPPPAPTLAAPASPAPVETEGGRRERRGPGRPRKAAGAGARP